MPSKIICGKYVICDADTIIPSGAVYLEEDVIVAVGSFDEIAATYTADEVIGSSDYLVTPGFINAHGHGKGITDFQRGVVDNTLETWKLRSYPYIDPYYDMLWATIQYLESGVTTVMHNHVLAEPDACLEEFSTAIEAYRKTGLRVAFGPLFFNANYFIYGDNEQFIRSLPQAHQLFARQIVNSITRYGPDQYFQSIKDLKKNFQSSDVRIFHSPVAPHWFPYEMLQEIKYQAKQDQLRINTHTSVNQLQAIYAHKQFGKTQIEHLNDLGFLGEDVTCSHCVWVSNRDIEMLAETGTHVTHHPSCNLRIRMGIAPVFAMLQKKVIVGLGMDDKEFGDDKDIITEMRLASRLHRITSHHLDSEHLMPSDVFRMATQYSAQTLGFDDIVGTLDVGKQADIVLFDLNRMSRPFVSPTHNPIDLLVYRGRGMDVHTVLIGGKVVLRNREPTQIDREEVLRKLQESIPENYAVQLQEKNQYYPLIRERTAAYFADWYNEMDLSEGEPFYLMNSKTL